MTVRIDAQSAEVCKSQSVLMICKAWIEDYEVHITETADLDDDALDVAVEAWFDRATAVAEGLILIPAANRAEAEAKIVVAGLLGRDAPTASGIEGRLAVVALDEMIGLK